MNDRIRAFLLAQALVFGSAVLMHAGLMPYGKGAPAAAIAESVIGVVLLAGLLTSLARPALTRTAGLAVQGFGFLGTCLGLTLVLTGVGPRSVLDVAYHIIMLALLGAGLVVTWRGQPHGLRPTT